MVYELRIYHMNPGKMEDTRKRFKDDVFPLWPKYGIKATEFWEDAEGKETMYYVCEFESAEAKDKLWKTFLSSDEWLKIKARTEADGPLVERVESYLMKNADFFSK